jgi:hypothetical protein
MVRSKAYMMLVSFRFLSFFWVLNKTFEHSYTLFEIISHCSANIMVSGICKLDPLHTGGFFAAIKAMEVGAAGIIVSNHGARQLDYTPATISVLEEVESFHRMQTV